MLFEKFKSEVEKKLNSHLSKVHKASISGKIIGNGRNILYPNMLIFTQCEGYFIAELIGATDIFNGLSIKTCKEKSIYKYLSQFEDSISDKGIHIDTSGVRFNSICFSRNGDVNKMKERFPSLHLYKTVLYSPDGIGSPISFGPNFESCAIENSAILNNKSSQYRCKDIQTMYIFSNKITQEKLTFTLDHFLNTVEVRCVRGFQDEFYEMVTIAGQLQNMYYFPRLHETSIGEFLKLHPKVVMQAFGSSRVEYEPHLKWVERDASCDDDAINPDLLVQRADGYFDIYDLKTALLTKKSITKGERKRRRFIDYVSDGIAQLANYSEYFSYPQNAKLAKEKYGIEVKDPKLVLVVGDWDNSCQEKITQALRAYKNIEVIDYDTLCKLFIRNN
ncbi:Shedu anti-phage system protein SduA domain-containing protein [Aeromonas caviae]|uniref:Shedu anti-phage system protein SduA domain-containing protein n=1 Tax=Aeromonas caviae TaxID=648 RepID=UPI001432E08F|nr:Shedu anti-phage system protein SduA domain-containing protein [Aeromonas caviae]NKD14626.1 DUF4263 domain-containing protein [Aeromonas caviae]